MFGFPFNHDIDDIVRAKVTAINAVGVQTNFSPVSGTATLEAGAPYIYENIEPRGRNKIGLSWRLNEQEITGDKYGWRIEEDLFGAETLEFDIFDSEVVDEFIPDKGIQHTYTVENLLEGPDYEFRVRRLTVIDG